MVNEIFREEQIPSIQLNDRLEDPHPTCAALPEHSEEAKATHPAEESLHVPVWQSLDRPIFHADINCAPVHAPHKWSSPLVRMRSP